MDRHASTRAVFTLAIVLCASVAARGQGVRSDQGGPAPPTPPNPSLGELQGSAAQCAIQCTVFQYEMVARQARGLLATDTGFSQNVLSPVLDAQPPGTSGITQMANWNDDGGVVVRGQNAPMIPSRWQVWANAYDVGGSVAETDMLGSLDHTAAGAQLGVFRLLDSGSVLGVFSGFAHQDVDMLLDQKTGDIDSGQLGVVLRTADVSDYSLFASAVAYDAYQVGRQAARSEFDGSQASAYFERGCCIPVGAMSLGPSLAIQYTWLHQEDFVETLGAPNLTFAAKNTNSLRSTIGSRLTCGRHTTWGHVTPELRAHWMHEYLDCKTSVAMTAVAAAPSISTGVNMGRDWAVLGAGLNLELGCDVCLFAAYDLQLNERATYHVACCGMQW
ncbi:MAG: autotransporter outer membrane beta-barrel domain-containing protein [Planctomycetes bacterium]|nr:autotransporter outer membrane beta-barrel domain-containing protein [Planctomycetota bacterium]